jgi:hypothetical protein
MALLVVTTFQLTNAQSNAQVPAAAFRCTKSILPAVNFTKFKRMTCSYMMCSLEILHVVVKKAD